MAGASLTGLADDSTNALVKAYPLKTCLVCGMELGMMGKPYVFVYQGQEIKVCDKSEQAEFDKDPKKFIKKLADAEAKFKK
jgi:YHS domain-containing protein